MRLRFIPLTCSAFAAAAALVAVTARRHEPPQESPRGGAIEISAPPASPIAVSARPRAPKPKKLGTFRPAMKNPPLPDWIDGRPRTHQELAKHWKGEPLDGEWTEDVRSYLLAMLEVADAGIDPVRTVECRRTLCRIELDASGAASLVHLNEAATSAHFRFTQEFTDTKDGPALVLFAPRQELADRILGPE